MDDKNNRPPLPSIREAHSGIYKPTVTPPPTRTGGRGKAAAGGSARGGTNSRERRPIDIEQLRHAAAAGPNVPPLAKRTGREEARSRRPATSPARFLWWLLLLLLALYLGGYVYTYLTTPRVAETRVEIGSVEQPKVYSAVIVRDEAVYRSAADGVAVFTMRDLEQVRVGGEIYSIQDATRVAAIESELKKINAQIIDMQAERAELSIYEDDIREDNAQIKKTVDNMSFRLLSGETKRIYELAESVRLGMDTRNHKLLSENRGSLKTLVEEREISQSLLAGAKQNAYAAESGVVSYLTDGQEELLTPDALGAITKEQTKMQIDYEALSYKKTVAAGDPVCKIVRSGTWYIAAYIPQDAAVTETDEDKKKWNVNSIVTIYIEEDGRLTPLETRVDRMEKSSETEYYIVFRCTRQMADYLHCRNLKIRLAQNVMEGLKIPNTSIVDKTLLKVPVECLMDDAAGRTIVMRRVNGLDESVAITVSAKNEVYADVVQDFNNLRFGDTLVVKSENGEPSGVRTIEELDNVKGVYVTNAGSTVFKRIDLGGNSMSNATYTVLDPKLNSNVRIHDKIVSDAKNIDEKQLTHKPY